MRLWLFRHVVLVITLGAFLSAGSVRAAWPVQAAASHDVTMMAQAGSDAPMPCKGMTPACMTDFGCIFMIGMPTVSQALSMNRLSWSPVSYGELFQLAAGLTRKPALDPPIFLG
jgi:hypothetical protein